MTMSPTYTFSTTYEVKYTNKEPIPLDHVIESLKSFEQLLKRAPAFIEQAYDGIHILETRVLIETIESGSLYEKFVVNCVFGGKENHANAQQVIDEIMKSSTPIKLIVAVGVGAMISYGVTTALSGAANTTHITAYDNNIINIGGTASLDASDIKMVLDSIGDKKTLAKQAINAIAPAKLDPNATIEINGQTDLTISKGYITEVPERYEPPVPDEKEERYTDVEVFIHASDRDNRDKGWAGSLPDLFETRTKFILGEDVQPNQLHGRTSVRAAVTVLYRYQKTKKDYTVKSVELTKIHPHKQQHSNISRQ